jgi:hypothetical protein
MSWAQLQARMKEKRDAYRILVGNLKKRDHLLDIGVDRRIILERIFKEI